MGNPGFARFEVQGIQIQVYRFCDLSYNLGQNKMEQQTPIPPQIKDEAARRPKTRHFPILDFGGRGGGGSRFSIYFVQDCSCSIQSGSEISR